MEDVKKENTIITKDEINYNIQTVLIHQKDDQRSMPIINLNSNDILQLSFDNLSNNINQLFYSRTL